MGKKLIIKGADFSQNGIAPIARQIFGVKTSADAQIVELIVPSTMKTGANVKFEYIVINRITGENAANYYSFGNPFNGRSYGGIGYTDGRETFTINGLRPDFSGLMPSNIYIPEVGVKNTVFVKTSETIINGITCPNTVGEASTDVLINGSKVLLFNDNVTAGSIAICRMQFYSEDGTTLLVDYVPAKDSNNVVCFWDTLSDTLCYANSGNLVEVTE